MIIYDKDKLKCSICKIKYEYIEQLDGYLKELRSESPKYGYIVHHVADMLEDIIDPDNKEAQGLARGYICQICQAEIKNDLKRVLRDVYAPIAAPIVRRFKEDREKE